MRDTIQTILTTELDRLKNKSDVDGLDLNDFRKLDLLIKAHREFSGDSSTRDTEEPDTPATQSVSDLLEGLHFAPAPV